MARILDTLQRHSLFAGLPREDLESLVLACRLKTPMKDDSLFRSGEPAEAFFIVESGAIKLWNVSPAGREIVVEVIRPGESFALMPVMDGGSYPVTATAVVDSAVVRIPREGYVRLLSKRPEAREPATREIAQRLRGVRKRLEEMMAKSVPSRVAAHVVRIAEQRGVGLHVGAVVDLGATREVVAKSIGTAREVLTRTLRRMEEDGVVALRGHRVEVRDPDRLRALAEG